MCVFIGLKTKKVLETTIHNFCHSLTRVDLILFCLEIICIAVAWVEMYSNLKSIKRQIVAIISNHLDTYPTPINLSYM